jgi:hypothetical protein
MLTLASPLHLKDIYGLCLGGYYASDSVNCTRTILLEACYKLSVHLKITPLGLREEGPDG